jgi:hypothetical protein
VAIMGFSYDPGPLPICTVRDAEKWLPRLANGQIEICGEGCDLPQRMVRVLWVRPIEQWRAEGAGLYVPPVYRGKKLILVYLGALDA